MYSNVWYGERLTSGKKPFAKILSVVISTEPPFFCNSHLIAAKEICGNMPWTSPARCWRRANSAGVGCWRDDAGEEDGVAVDEEDELEGGEEEYHRKNRYPINRQAASWGMPMPGALVEAPGLVES